MFDVWFARHDGFLYYATAEHGEPPAQAVLIKSVAQAYRRLRHKGIEIAQVGIADAEMLGLT